MTLPKVPNPRTPMMRVLSLLGAATTCAGATVSVRGAYILGILIAVAGAMLTFVATWMANRAVLRAQADLRRQWEQYCAERGWTP